MKRYLITFAYDGSNYNGYQRQPKLKTIQGEIEKALTKINGGKKVEIHASGRTDAKVHALNQKAHFDLKMQISCLKLKRALNSNVSSDIYIKEVKETNSDFHARYYVKAKEYIYIINTGEYNPIERNAIYQYNKKLNSKHIKKALKLLKGEHDFSAFASQEELKEDCVRKIYKAKLMIKGSNIILVFLANGFLKYQVRNMVGTLIEIGEEKRRSQDITNILISKDRKKAGKKAKPEGLYLSKVIY